MKILTNQKQIPWIWAFLVLFPWFAISVREQISVAGMTFTLRKFIDNPAIIGLVISSNFAFSLTLGAVVAFISDHIWTRWGRRRPFLIVSFLISGFISLFIPFADVAWFAIGLIVMYQMMVDFAGPYEPFTMEVIPSQQRGRAQAITQWYKKIGVAVALALLIGNFDKVYAIAGWISFNGETVMYWANSACLILSALFLIFFTREEKTETTLPRASIRHLLIHTLWRELTQPRMLRIMGLVFVMQNLWLGALQYEALLITEQWGYQKSTYGNFMTLSLVFTVDI